MAGGQLPPRLFRSLKMAWIKSNWKILAIGMGLGAVALRFMLKSTSTQAQGVAAPRRVQGVGLVSVEKRVAGRRMPVQQQLDVIVPGRPRVAEQDRTFLVKDARQRIAQAIQSLAERAAPGLRPPRTAAGATSAVLAPTTDPVGATP